MKKKFFNMVFKLFKEQKSHRKNILIAVSGGLDSVVLLHLLKELSPSCDLKLYTVYIHHGPSSKKNLKNYRNQAQKFVKNLSLSYGLDCICPEPSKKKLHSEEEMRLFRQKNLNAVQAQTRSDLIALGHHKNDRLETQLIQLIRGCGIEGLKSMSEWTPPYVRPLLSFSKKDIQTYAIQNQLQWLEDPSNQNKDYLRNWIRNKWLPDLEKQRSGSIKSLARSLDTLISKEKEESFLSAIEGAKINKALLIGMPYREQKRLLAFYMKKQKFSNYGQSHIEEILKQLERKEKNFSIRLLKKTWTFKPKWISITHNT